MTTRFLTGFIAVAGTITLFPVQAAPIAGCDFANGAAFDSTTDDLLAADGISVSNWSTAGGGAITGDGNGNADRFSAPVGKFNGPSLPNGIPPVVGSAPPTEGIHSFTISISAGTTINLTNISFDFSKATDNPANRWLAFRTSLDTGLLYSENGPARPAFTSVDLDLTDAKYQNLSDTTVTFYWYSGGEGSGDCDIDSIVIDAEVAAANPPTVTNSAATNVEATTATLNGIVTDTGGAAPLITIFYGTSDGGTNPGNWSNSVDLGNEAAAFTTDITGLSPSTHYFFRAYGENSGGIDWAPTSATFTTNAIFPPAIDNAPAINITGTSARVGGEVTNTGGSPPVVTLYWGDNDGGTNTGAWDNSVNLGIQSGAFISDLTNLTQITTYYFRCLAVNGGGSVWASPTETFTTLEVQDLVVNEFMAANDGGATNNPNAWYPIANQVSGRTDDWIEIANRSAGPLPLDGWFLTDDSGDLTQWAFPAGTSIPGNSFLIVYASGDGIPDTNGNLHTNFKLSKGGDYLAIVNPSFTVVSEFASGGSDYPNQNDDVSYGLHPVTELPVFFSSPTPGAANDPNGQAQVGDTKFNLNRGYYQTAINVEITSATQGATIYYTTDGTLPIDTGGTPSASAITYTGPIGLTQTTAVRAAAVKTGLTPTNVDCNTYFLLDIDGAASDGTDTGGLNLPFLQQTQPAGWGSLSSGDYNMDPDVSQETTTATDHPTSTAQTMLKGMRDIPTISIVMDREDFSGSNGIYTNSTLKGFAWERACSAEFIPAENDTRSDWQENCGLRVQGGASRNPGSSPKHSLSFRFREDYGVGKLREPLFPGSDVEEFNVIALRAGYNNSWIHSNAGQRGNGSMIRDQWVRQTMLDMGNSAAGEGFMSHVYVNGLYWGLHNICERADASHYGEHKGVDGDLIDARNGSEYTDGNGTAWNQISGVVNSGDWTKIQQVINIDNYIDYQLVNRYGANQDLKTSGNWRAAGGGAFPSGMPEQMSPWDLFAWDSERTLESQTASSVPLDPMGVRGTLESNSEYQVRLADRVQKHFYGNGALTPAQTEARWEKYASDIDRAIIAESARWGDHRRATPYTRDAEWLTEQTRLYTDYFPVRTTNVLNNLSLLSVAAPIYLVGGSPQVEGLIPAGASLTVTGSGTIYYTTDGTDPRLDGGTISPNATSVASGSTIPISSGALVKARGLSGANWSAVTEGIYLVGPIADSTNIVVSELMYNPAGMDENTEFIELMNISTTDSIDLSLATFSGIDYTFPLGVSLAPGERIVIVKDPIAFATVYNIAGMRIAPGDYGSSLSNDGEEVAFINGLGVDAKRFTYNDVDPWPRAADGDGFTLTLIDPSSNPNHGLASNWRSSVAPNGTPSGSDSVVFSGDPLADNDNDGLNAFLEYALGSIAGDVGASPEAIAAAGTGAFDDGNGGTTDFLTLSYRRNLAADDVMFQVQLSSDLDSWNNAGSEYVTSVSNGDGTETVTIRSLSPMSGLEKEFIRLKVSLTP
ncbi:lamin tail domain-containing protein [Akkermansiaceae bacterium]|nr:lamin tail domain-containing protein [Akkermansiaceae bacterium]MDB4388103.1 lamin tail domain-containing protein [Akkermansiaceae bacterium]MDB4433817.1 lamin tail domain-containing protein [Akkermansiaceae bacterium]MDB4569430.1 lamin tail domain-containing protein [Akkermansiaceae bacterium]